MTASDRDFPLRVDFHRVLETLSSRIYDTPYAFLRENVQNSIDAIRIQAARDQLPSSDRRYRVDITVSAQTCSIRDNGVGMNRDELARHFWTMGASGKTNAEARDAGCIGFFGIGGFANFGVCSRLEVISRTEQCHTAHHTALSSDDFPTEPGTLPTVRYHETDDLSDRGTLVRGTAKASFEERALSGYLKEFVRYVPEAVYFNGTLLSRETVDAPRGTYRTLTDRITWHADELFVTFQVFVDDGHNLSAQIDSVRLGDKTFPCTGYVRLVHGQLEVYKRGFRICAVSISSRIGVTGRLDCDVLQPTAGRDTLASESLSLLNQMFRIIEAGVTPFILNDPDLLENHIRLLPDLAALGNLEKLGLLVVTVADGRRLQLSTLRELSQQGKRIFFTSSNRVSSAAEVLQARGHIIVALSGNAQRRSIEMQYLKAYCKGEAFDNLIECLEIYEDRDQFDRAVLAELDFVIKRLFKPPEFRFTAGKLTLDVPIFWSSHKDGGATVVFVDTRHGEFQKLKPLGYGALFWSMIEAFCREYLGDTLKRQSPKFFGSGAIDLDAYSRSHAELWELLSSDIEISRIASAVELTTRRPAAMRIEVVRSSDIAQLTISAGAGVTTTAQAAETAAESPSIEKSPPKLLRIVDETKTTGLEGYYLRIPESATAAFGDIIRTFPSFAVVWFANRITWQGSDLKSTAFLFDITLDYLIDSPGDGKPAHGALELQPGKVQTYAGQIYFYIPSPLETQLIPRSDIEPVKIEIRHELLDLGRTRSWTSRQPFRQPVL